jgi:amino acid permease
MKKRLLLGAMTACFVMSFAALVFAEEKFGITVYPDAEFDASTTKVVSTMSSMVKGAACYRTKDSVAKVVEFYKKQSGLRNRGVSAQGGMFTKGSMEECMEHGCTDVTIQSPWMDTKTGKMNNDTLISIVENQM